jgi:hypothetical protein
MSIIHIEIKQAIVRRYADGHSFAAGDAFNLVGGLDFVGRGEVQLSADLALPSAPITRADLKELKRQLQQDYHVQRSYCWRLRGLKPPYAGRIIRENGPLVLWEMSF